MYADQMYDCIVSFDSQASGQRHSPALLLLLLVTLLRGILGEPSVESCVRRTRKKEQH
jgi:hypothetical protein